MPLSIVWLGLSLEFPNPLLLKIANNVLISIVLQMFLFGDRVVVLIFSNNYRKVVSITCGSKDVAMRIC